MQNRDRRISLAVFTMVAMVLGALPAPAEEGSDSLPWTVEDLKESYTVGTKITYSRSGTNKKGEEAGGTHYFEVKDAGPKAVAIDSVWQDGGGKSSGFNQYYWDQDLMFLESMSKAEFEITGAEQIETPAGTFDTVVVKVKREFFDDWKRQTYWLIPDQPGVYAKLVDHGSDEKPANIVMILQEVSRPGS